MRDIIFIKRVNDYDDILKEKHNKMPIFFKKIIFMYKNMFNIITKKKIENINLWILPIQDKYSNNKIEKIIKKMSIYKENIYVITDELRKNGIYKLMDKNSLSYLKGEKIKKYLVIKILEYINNIQNGEIINKDVTILASELSEYNIYLIEKLSKLVKSVKIVSNNIYKFKKIEEKLYNNFGIAVQLSNSYKKSLLKSKLIINLDFNKIDINEYDIFDKAIIINCGKEDIKINTKLFNGIVINSYNIKFKKEIKDKFRKMDIYNKYNNLLLYESNIYEEKDFSKILEKFEEDKVIILNLLGNNGIIDKNEFKNINKKLDK